MHIVLAGDSIFDNGAYVPDGPALVDVLRAADTNFFKEDSESCT